MASQPAIYDISYMILRLEGLALLGLADNAVAGGGAWVVVDVLLAGRAMSRRLLDFLWNFCGTAKTGYKNQGLGL